MKKILKPLAIFLSLIILVVGIPVSIHLVNNYSAYAVEKQLCALALPPQTERVESLSQAGKFVGNGNGMQYFGAILIRSELSMDELLIHYQTALPGAVVKAQTTQQIECIEHGTIQFDTPIRGDGYYIVYFFGSGIKPFSQLDIRGH